MKAVKADYGFFMIINGDDTNEDAIQSVFAPREKFKKEQGRSLPGIVVDARVKISVSKNDN